MTQIDDLQYILDNSSKIVFFTGAGVSTDSWIPDFRSKDGLYRQKYMYSPERILSASYFENHPEEFFTFYRDKIIYNKNIIFNYTHTFIKKYEDIGKSLGVITQNIDGLHNLCGSKNIIELHGSIFKNHCLTCGKKFNLEYIKSTKTNVPYCECCGYIKPDIVLYEESLDENDIIQAISMIEKADTLIVLGTSLSVYPAASFVDRFKGNKLVIINRTTTNFDKKADLCINDSLSNILQQITIR